MRNKMKLRYILGLALSALLLAGCSDDDQRLGTYGDITLSQSYLSIPAQGGDVTVTVSATEEWSFDKLFSVDVVTGKDESGKNITQKKYFALPVKLSADKTDGEYSWLTASQLEGPAGQAVITFHADAASGGREAALSITMGDKQQNLIVRQGSLEASPSTCADVIAGPEGKTYQVTGTVVAIANTTYGNWYLDDGTGQVYIYGTLDANGGTKNFTSLGIEVGDVVTVKGPKTVYGTTVELVDVTVVKIVKSLLKVLTAPVTLPKEGGDIEVAVAYKGSGAYCSIGEEAKGWIKYTDSEYRPGVKTLFESSPADTVIFRFSVEPNLGGLRAGELTFQSGNGASMSTVTYKVSQEANVLPHGQEATDPYTVAEAIARCQEIGSATDGVIYFAKGKISSVKEVSTTYGNATFSISDDGAEQNELVCYRSYYLENVKFTATDQIKVGDEVVVTGKLVNYNGATPEFSGSVYIYSLNGKTK